MERDRQENSMPINYRIYDKREGKTKNDYFFEMLTKVMTWGLPNSISNWYQVQRNLFTLVIRESILVD